MHLQCDVAQDADDTSWLCRAWDRTGQPASSRLSPMSATLKSRSGSLANAESGQDSASAVAAHASASSSAAAAAPGRAADCSVLRCGMTDVILVMVWVCGAAWLRVRRACCASCAEQTATLQQTGQAVLRRVANEQCTDFRNRTRARVGRVESRTSRGTIWLAEPSVAGWQDSLSWPQPA